MKKGCFLLFLLSLSLFGLTSTAIGKEIGPCLEVWMDSAADWDSRSSELYQISLNGDGMVSESWKLAFDLTWGLTGNRDNTAFVVTRSFMFKGGYAVIKHPIVKTDLTARFFGIVSLIPMSRSFQPVSIVWESAPTLNLISAQKPNFI